MLDYETLRLIWWGLLGALLIGFTILDGFDLGVAILLPFVGKKEEERQTIVNSIAPFWEGNQVWLILGAGASFAAWPYLYAVSFSGFYFAIFLALFALILRPVGFKFRSKMPSSRWRSFWDWMLFIGGAGPAFIFGVAFGNLFVGAPFHFDDTLRLIFTGSFLDLVRPFPLLCGLVSLAMMVFRGGTYLALKTSLPLAERAQKSAFMAGGGLFFLFAAGGLWITFGLEGFQITSDFKTTAASNPLHKVVQRTLGGWLYNYTLYPLSIGLPILGFFSMSVGLFLLKFKKHKAAFCASSCTLFAIIATAGASLYPFLMPSNTHPNHSLTIWDASSSQLTLFIMLLAVLIFMPIVLIYTAWVYRLFRGKVTNVY